MSDLSSLDCARALTAPVGDLGARWMFHPDTLAPAKGLGYPNGFVYYAAGRGGVLGDVAPDVVTAAFGYFSPDTINKVWAPGIAVEGARAASQRYAAACGAFGSARLAGADGLDRFVELAERVIDGADVSGLPLFAGWRAAPRPDDAAGRAFFCLHLLRELRGSVHVVATTASGLTPLQSILAAPVNGGPERAKVFGWSEPFPDASAFVAARAAAEDLTDQLVARHLEVLTPAERAELVALVERLKAMFEPG